MKKILLILTCLSLLKTNAQIDLKFDKRFIDSEDKWVTFQKGEENEYMFGFIYIDPQAGLTLNYEGTFKISENNVYIPSEKENKGFTKARLENNNVKISWIPENRFKELKISKIPDWLKHYKTDIESTQRLYNWGFMYNGWNKCEKALTYLEKAYNQEPDFKNLGVELAYSYNCLGRYNEAINILKSVVKSNPKDSYSNKELIYAQIKSGNLNEASKSVKKAIKKTSGEYNGENIYNLLYSYYQKKDLKNTKKWIKLARKWNEKNDKILSNIDNIEGKTKQ